MAAAFENKYISICARRLPIIVFNTYLCTGTHAPTAMCILRKIPFFCPDCRSTGDPTRNGVKRIFTSESSTNRMILCSKYENDKLIRHEKRRQRQDTAVRAERNRLEEVEKAAKKLAMERAEKKSDEVAGSKDKDAGEGEGKGGEGSTKVSKLDKKQKNMRDDAQRIAAGESDDEAGAGVAKLGKEKKISVGNSDAFGGLMKKIEREKRQIRDNPRRRLACGERMGRGVRVVKQGNHQIQEEVANFERLCDAHIKIRAKGSKRWKEGLRGEAKMVEKWMVPGDLAMAVRWKEQGKKPKPLSVQSTLFFDDSASEEAIDDWAADKENMDGRENYKKVETERV